MKNIMWLNSKFHSTISRHHLEIVSRQKYRKNTDFGCFASFRSPLRPRDSSNSSFSPFPSLFCLSCPLLLSSHGPWPWLHVKPDTPHSLFSHHAVTSSAHHTALATASLYLSLSLYSFSAARLSVWRLRQDSGGHWVWASWGKARSFVRQRWGWRGLKLRHCWKDIAPFPQQRNTTAAQNLKRSPALARAMGGKHIPAHMITCAPAHTLTLNIIQAFLNKLWQTCFKHRKIYGPDLTD